MTTCEVPACPACGAENYDALGSADCGEPGLGFEVRRCRTCDLYFKSRRPDDITLAAVYRSFDVTIHDDPTEIFPPEELIRERLAVLPAGSRVLDYGCCTGRFLAPFTQKFSCHGIEPQPAGAAIARQRGVRIIDDDGLAGDFSESFDLILMSDVFEHLISPTATLARLARALRPGGSLLLATGIADAIPHDAHLPEFWYLQNPYHLIMLSRGHVSWLADRLGLLKADFRQCHHYQVSVIAGFKQRLRLWAYGQFHDHTPDRGGWTGLLRLVPKLKDVEALRVRPTLHLYVDHALVTFTKPARF
jgi:SAM-dependent methyltransferase